MKNQLEKTINIFGLTFQLAKSKYSYVYQDDDLKITTDREHSHYIIYKLNAVKNHTKEGAQDKKDFTTVYRGKILDRDHLDVLVRYSS